MKENNNIEDVISKFHISNNLGLGTSYASGYGSSKRKISLEEILDEESDDEEFPDFSDWKCKTCGEAVDENYSWYYLRHEIDGNKSVVLCSMKCLRKFLNDSNYSDFEIFEFSRCSAYFKCRDIDNLRRMCERVENKSYISISNLSIRNYCEPAQAGSILSTHKLTEVLQNFSKQTEEQYLSNKEMMDKGAEESSKQFKITSWMSILVIILTVINMVPAFINWGADDYPEQLSNIESKMDEINSAKELNEINNKLDEILKSVSDNENTDLKTDEIIRLLESIESKLSKDEFNSTEQ